MTKSTPAPSSETGTHEMSSRRRTFSNNNSRSGSSRSTSPRDRYGTLQDDEPDDDDLGGGRGMNTSTSGGGGAAAGAGDGGDDVGYLLQSEENDGLMRTGFGGGGSRRRDPNRLDYVTDDHSEDGGDDDDDDDGAAISLQELLYSSSSYYAIAKPVTITMILASLAVVFVNNDETRAEGEQAMASAYQVWTVDPSNASSTSSQNLALSLANALVMVSVICAMTFVIVLLYKFRCMKCLIGYMMLSSGILLGVLGGNLLQAAIHIYRIPVDKLTFFVFVFNFCLVGVMAVFWGKGIPKYVTQGYLVATSVILAWHLSYFDDWTTWSLLFMLALYDLCAVLTPCGPLKALVNLMSEDEAPEMPGLLFEAELPAEAKRPGVPKASSGRLSRSSSSASRSASGEPTPQAQRDPAAESMAALPSTRSNAEGSLLAAAPAAEPPTVNIPFAIAKVYNLQVVSVPDQSKKLMFPQSQLPSAGAASQVVSSAPLLQDHDAGAIGAGNNHESSLVENLPENPTPTQLRAVVAVRLPPHGGRIEQVSRRGKRVYLERDRHGEPKRLLWVDRNGKVFAEMRSDDEDGPERNTIRLGLGDFIFYSVMVAKAAQYSFATFASCYVVILAGLGGTLVLLSVYHHALPALPISIFLGVIFYLVTRAFIEPWIEAVLNKPLYV